MSEITVDAIEGMAKSLKELREEIDADKAILSEKNAALDELENKIVLTLKELGKTSYRSEYGTVSRNEKWRVNLPATPEDRAEFFEYLKNKGLFENMITVNSNTLNSYYMKEWEQAKGGDPEEALNFKVPGIGEPKLYEALSFRKK